MRIVYISVAIFLTAYGLEDGIIEEDADGLSAVQEEPKQGFLSNIFGQLKPKELLASTSTKLQGFGDRMAAALQNSDQEGSFSFSVDESPHGEAIVPTDAGKLDSEELFASARDIETGMADMLQTLDQKGTMTALDKGSLPEMSTGFLGDLDSDQLLNVAKGVLSAGDKPVPMKTILPQPELQVMVDSQAFDADLRTSNSQNSPVDTPGAVVLAAAEDKSKEEFLSGLVNQLNPKELLASATSKLQGIGGRIAAALQTSDEQGRLAASADESPEEDGLLPVISQLLDPNQLLASAKDIQSRGIQAGIEHVLQELNSDGTPFGTDKHSVRDILSGVLATLDSSKLLDSAENIQSRDVLESIRAILQKPDDGADLSAVEEGSALEMLRNVHGQIHEATKNVLPSNIPEAIEAILQYPEDRARLTAVEEGSVMETLQNLHGQIHEAANNILPMDFLESVTAILRKPDGMSEKGIFQEKSWEEDKQGRNMETWEEPEWREAELELEWLEPQSREQAPVFERENSLWIDQEPMKLSAYGAGYVEEPMFAKETGVAFGQTAAGREFPSLVGGLEMLNERVAGPLSLSFEIIQRDISAMIHTIQRNITEHDLIISHQLLIGPTGPLINSDIWTWDSEIIIRGAINSYSLEFLAKTHAFRRPDVFDIVNLLRSFFCHQYPCEAGFCALARLHTSKTAHDSLYSLWDATNGNFQNGESPITSLRNHIPDKEQITEVLRFWSFMIDYLENVNRQISAMAAFPYSEQLAIALKYSSLVTCVCQKSFTGLFCEIPPCGMY